MELSIEKLRKNLFNIINFAIKEDFKYINRTRNLEITIFKIINSIDKNIENNEIKKRLKKFKLELGNYSFADERTKKELLISIYDFFKNPLPTQDKKQLTRGSNPLSNKKNKQPTSDNKNKQLTRGSNPLSNKKNKQPTRGCNPLLNTSDSTPLSDKKKKQPLSIQNPDNIEFFFKKVEELPFVSQIDAKKLNSKGIFLILDLLYTFPKKYQDYSQVSVISRDLVDFDIQITGKVINKRVSNGRRRFMVVELSTAGGLLNVVLFNYQRAGYIYKIGQNYILRGKLQENNFFNFHMVHPEIITLKSGMEDDIEEHLKTDVKYGNVGITEKKFKKIITKLLDEYEDFFVDFIPSQFVKENHYLPFYENVKILHQPEFDKPEDENSYEIYYERLKFEEFFMLSIKNLLKKQKIKRKTGIKVEIDLELHQKFLKSLPFELTEDQLRSINDIFEDLSADYPANRLIQGDVGSGKTIVAAAAMLQAVNQGYQVVIMVPTEILALQHHSNLAKLFEKYDILVQLFVSKMKKKAKDLALLQMAHGKPQIFVGTHALIQKRVNYKNPALIIVDEQHRFGVLQRKSLQDIAKGVNVLLMSATPIPRTLSMGLFGDLDISYIEQMPKSRKVIKTSVVRDLKKELTRIFKFLSSEIKEGRQAYIIFPLIEESEVLDARSLIENFELFSNKYFSKFKTALLHGRMKSDEKEQAMNDFKDKKTDILFATTVIEVGIDVPNASVMVIMNSERFGLSQLHQIRGRIGRGVAQSYCFLVSPRGDSERLSIMEKNSSGFQIAKEDLKLRGPGDIYGVDQSGVPNFKFLDFDKDEAIIVVAMQAADRYIRYDPKFNKNPILKKYLELLQKNSYVDIS